ncbi:hypothetical protein [Polycladidibacter hongkongensis]|uniref:hypothetical protein n=1 Tax=Polycladidibacter hongkongensis TaxID=1647556 RepID=UPI00082B6709|nr:hypothetical protein [Pseudovibrio hongkongensis]
MTCKYSIVHHAVGRIDPNAEGHDIRANAMVVRRPTRAPARAEIMYAPLELNEVATGIYSAQTPHGEIHLRLTGLFGGRVPKIEPYKSYVLLMGASGTTARIDNCT